MNQKEYSAKKLRMFRFGGVIFFISSFIFAILYTGGDKFLKDCVAKGNSVKYCNDIYDNRKLAFQKEKNLIENKLDLKSQNLLFRGENYTNGSSYFGQFLNDKPHGFGTLIEVNGDKYIGQWSNGEMNGHGTFIWGSNSRRKFFLISGSKFQKRGDKYIGQWSNGEINGQGTYIWGPKSKKNLLKYSGDWKNGKMIGFGKLTFSDGAIYIGEFLKNKMHGQGMLISSTKEKQFGEWRNGKKIRKKL